MYPHSIMLTSKLFIIWCFLRFSYSVLCTPPEFAWLRTCVSAFGFNILPFPIFLLLYFRVIWLAADKLMTTSVIGYNIRSWPLFSFPHRSMAEKRKHLPEDVVEYFLFPTLPENFTNSKVVKYLEELLDSYLAFVSPLVLDHIWQNDPFSLVVTAEGLWLTFRLGYRPTSVPLSVPCLSSVLCLSVNDHLLFDSS